MSRRIRVLIVDDSTFVRQALTRMLGADPEIVVAGQAVDGREAIDKVHELDPDVVTMDVQMPRMGGLEALARIMAEHPVPVLLLSSLTREGAEVTLKGLELGALDFVDKSRVQGAMNLLELGEELRAKVKALGSIPASRLRAAPVALARLERPVASDQRAELVVIGTSTGGPAALQAIIPRLPEGLHSAVLVVQHMPPGFTRSLAERLASMSALPVREAEDGEPVAAGQVLIAPAGIHMKLRRRGAGLRVWLDEEPRSALHRPAVDVLMASAAKLSGERCLGVLLTGMGSDGVAGLRAIREAGGRTFAESEETCVIYGMPKAAAEAGVVDRSVPLHRMADEILAAV
ncbi:MAG: chemotaxis response regulator protein-glutamate methylesterase [Vicinamibacteria bacterium]|nr:chemotaxis response regulator protein-glutamate methylesterase [Vicinamibacteria bacterium]